MNNSPSSDMSSVLKALAYFDVFQFPLSEKELLRYSDFPNKESLNEELSWLEHFKMIFRIGNYYALTNDVLMVKQRREGDERVKEYIDQALKKSRLIAKFPYVRGVFISGSLSKGTMTENGDIDFFIVTTPNRLWIARSLLIAYKKIFLLNSRKYFCINYLIDDETLEIQHKNRFTATELITMWPIVNQSLYYDLMSKNEWVKSYYPQGMDYPERISQTIDRGMFQSILESILNLKWGGALDDFLMKLTLARWRKKFSGMSNSDFDVALKTTKRVSKHHPSNFQKRVLSGYEQRVESLEKKINEIHSLA
jgi:predicted nucleotidyltransferase